MTFFFFLSLRDRAFAADMALNNQHLSLVELHNNIPFEVNMQKHNGSVYLIVDGTYSLFYIMNPFKVTVFHV